MVNKLTTRFPSKMSAQGHFEAVKYALRQSKDGYVVSFVVHPDDVPDDLSKSKIGTRYMVAFAEIGEDEKPQAPVAQTEEHQPSKPVVEGSSPSGRTKRSFHELPLSQQAALRCNDARFRDWLVVTTPGLSGCDADGAAQIVRAKCGVLSRSEFDTNENAARRWKWLDEAYGRYEVTMQYAEYAR